MRERCPCCRHCLSCLSHLRHSARSAYSFHASMSPLPEEIEILIGTTWAVVYSPTNPLFPLTRQVSSSGISSSTPSLTPSSPPSCLVCRRVPCLRGGLVCILCCVYCARVQSSHSSLPLLLLDTLSTTHSTPPTHSLTPSAGP
jgi:hypothetical protein